MKTKVAVLLTTVFVASMSFAQNTSTIEVPTADGASTKGVRIGLVKSVLRADLEVTSEQYGPFKASADIDDSLGLSLGYASLPVQELGWAANATYINITNNGASLGLARIDGNLAYAFNSLINVKGGLNVSKLTDEEASKYDAGVGFQGGIGFQLTKKIGLDLGYTQMRQSGSFSGLKIDAKESGLEVGLNGTF